MKVTQLLGRSAAALALTAALFVFAGCPSPTSPDKKPVPQPPPPPPPPEYTIATLTEKAAEAQNLLDTVQASEDGTDIEKELYWVPVDLYIDLENVILDANMIIDYETDNPGETTSEEIEECYNNLVSIITRVTEAKTLGTFGEGSVRVEGSVQGAAWGTVYFYTDAADQTTSQVAAVPLNRTTTWNTRIDDDFVGQTIYARLDFSNSNNRQSSSGVVSFTLAAAGNSGVVITMPTTPYIFDEKENIAPYAQAESEQGSSTVNNVNDKDYATKWTSGSNTPTLELNFFTPVKINWITIRDYRESHNQYGNIKNFRINSWDGSAWQLVYEEMARANGLPAGVNSGDAPYHIPVKTILTTTKLQLVVSDASIQPFEIEAFLVPDREAFMTRIAEAKAALANTQVSSLGGNDVLPSDKWVTQSDKDALLTAVSVAEGINVVFDKTGQEIADALSAMETAFTLFVPADGLKTLAPTADVTTATKTAAADTSVTFALTGSYESTAVWRVYTEQVGGTALANVTAALSGQTLTLQNTTGRLIGGDYYVSVQNQSKAESTRLKLTVISPAGQTPQPVVGNAVVLKTAVSASVDFTLTNSAAYTNPVWKVYNNAAATTLATGVTATLTSATLSLAHASDVPTGNYWVTAEDSPDPESDPVKLTVAAPLQLVRASIADTSRNTLRVEFKQAAATVDPAKFTVKVNDLPNVDVRNNGATSAYAANAGKPWLDMSLKTTRTVTAAVVVAGSGSKEWDLTMSAPAEYGEIIRLAAIAEGGAEADGYVLPKVPGLIVKNGVQRTKTIVETDPAYSAANFYVINAQGTVTTPITPNAGGTDLFSKAFDHLRGTGNYQNGSTYVIKLGADQDWSQTSTWWFNPTYNGTQRYTIIIVSDDGSPREIKSGGNNDDVPIMGIKAGITLIIGENVTIDAKGRTGLAGAFYLGQGGKLILDGGTLKNSNSGVRGGVAVMDQGPGQNDTTSTYPVFILINSGTIEGLNNNVSPVSLNIDSVVVMHGGAIQNNTATSGNNSSVKAGAIGLGGASQNVNANHLGAAGVYITGGSITGNTVASGATATAGAIVTTGEFQKTGGVVSGNTINSTGNNKGQIVVLTAPNANPAAGSAFIRTADSGADDTLFVDCVKSAKDTAGTFTVPVWAASSWD